VEAEELLARASERPEIWGERDPRQFLAKDFVKPTSVTRVVEQRIDVVEDVFLGDRGLLVVGPETLLRPIRNVLALRCTIGVERQHLVTIDPLNRGVPIECCRIKSLLDVAAVAIDFCIDAGPCGYRLYRLLMDKGIDCAVSAPSLIPRKPGERIKTNRRDARKLAELHRAGVPTLIVVPGRRQESVRV
jgi:hypothetical protein